MFNQSSIRLDGGITGEIYSSDQHEEEIQALSGSRPRKGVYGEIYKKVMPNPQKSRIAMEDSESPFEKYKQQYVSWADKNDKAYQKDLRKRNKAFLERTKDLAHQKKYEMEEKS